MPQSIAKVAIHIVFSTKHRKPWLQSRELRDELFAYMATILRDNVDSPAVVINGVEDHLHTLCLLSRKFPIMKVIQEAKTETSKWLKKQSRETIDFTWQSGYGAFSVSESNILQVKEYIENQEDHHRRFTFQDEFRKLCNRHGIELDERYAWDIGTPRWGFGYATSNRVPRAAPWADIGLTRWAEKRDQFTEALRE